MEGPESIEVVNELAQSTDGFAFITTGTQSVPVEKKTDDAPAAPAAAAAKQRTPCRGCGKIHGPYDGDEEKWSILEVSPDGKSFSERELPPPGSSSKEELLAAIFGDRGESALDHLNRQQGFVEPKVADAKSEPQKDATEPRADAAKLRTDSSPQTTPLSEDAKTAEQLGEKAEALLRDLASVGMLRAYPHFPYGRLHRPSEPVPQTGTKSSTSTRSSTGTKSSTSTKSSPASSSSASARLRTVPDQALRKGISEALKLASVPKSDYRAPRLLAVFESVSRLMKTSPDCFSRVDRDDFDLLANCAKRIVKTRDPNAVVRFLDEAEAIASLKRADQSIQRVFKYAMAVIRTLSGQIALEYLRAK